MSRKSRFIPTIRSAGERSQDDTYYSVCPCCSALQCDLLTARLNQRSFTSLCTAEVNEVRSRLVAFHCCNGGLTFDELPQFGGQAMVNEPRDNYAFRVQLQLQ